MTKMADLILRSGYSVIFRISSSVGTRVGRVRSSSGHSSGDLLPVELNVVLLAQQFDRLVVIRERGIRDLAPLHPLPLELEVIHTVLPHHTLSDLVLSTNASARSLREDPSIPMCFTKMSNRFFIPVPCQRVPDAEVGLSQGLFQCLHALGIKRNPIYETIWWRARWDLNPGSPAPKAYTSTRLSALIQAGLRARFRIYCGPF